MNKNVEVMIDQSNFSKYNDRNCDYIFIQSFI